MYIVITHSTLIDSLFSYLNYQSYGAKHITRNAKYLKQIKTEICTKIIFSSRHICLRFLVNELNI